MTPTEEKALAEKAAEKWKPKLNQADAAVEGACELIEKEKEDGL